MADQNQTTTDDLPPLRVSGAFRDAQHEHCVILYCSRRPTDDELRALHDAARFWPDVQEMIRSRQQ